MGRYLIIDDIQIDVVRKKGKHSLSLKINRKTGRPEVSIPYLCPLFMAKSFVESHLIWLKKNMQMTPQKQTFCDQMHLSVLGKEVSVMHTQTRVPSHIEGDLLIVSGAPEHLHRRVKDFIKSQLDDYINIKAREVAQITGQSIQKITIKDTASRWGSCSSTHTLSFCWRLALAPQFVLDYVIIHEVAHLSHMDHSPAFWACVRQLGGQTVKAKKWLNENSAYLHSFL